MDTILIQFALRGFADSLHMELLPYKIGVSVLYPPNTETEGFKVRGREVRGRERWNDSGGIVDDARGIGDNL